jgi:hypothetical protein
MEHNKKDFFWPSYVDLMTALFAVMLVLFILSYFNFKNKKEELEGIVKIKEQEAEILNKVKANLKLFETDKEIFLYDTIYNRIQIAFEIKFKMGYQYYQIDSSHIATDYTQTTKKLDVLGNRLESIISQFKTQKMTDPTMKDISYLMVVSGSASRWGNEYENFILSYKRALSLYNYWKSVLKVDFDSPNYQDIVELQIAGIGAGGVGRFNVPFNPNNRIEEEKNQRFIIYITPKLGK